MSVTRRTALILAGLAIAVVAFYFAVVLIPRDAGQRPPDGETIIDTTTTIPPPSTSP